MLVSGMLKLLNVRDRLGLYDVLSFSVNRDNPGQSWIVRNRTTLGVLFTGNLSECITWLTMYKIVRDDIFMFCQYPHNF